MITINIAKKIIRALLRFLRIRSKCCDAPIVYTFGYDYRYDGNRCTKCGRAV